MWGSRPPPTHMWDPLENSAVSPHAPSRQVARVVEAFGFSTIEAPLLLPLLDQITSSTSRSGGMSRALHFSFVLRALAILAVLLTVAGCKDPGVTGVGSALRFDPDALVFDTVFANSETQLHKINLI